jgi:hypothetical protein
MHPGSDLLGLIVGIFEEPAEDCWSIVVNLDEEEMRGTIDGTVPDSFLGYVISVVRSPGRLYLFVCNFLRRVLALARI